MNKSVSLYAFGMAVALVIYMVISFAGSAINLISNFPELWNSAMGKAGEGVINSEIVILHGIAFTVVLIKAYRILISYAKTHHINLKYVVEISVIAPAIEIIFNTHTYTMYTILGVYGTVNLIIYILFYEKFVEVGKETH